MAIFERTNSRSRPIFTRSKPQEDYDEYSNDEYAAPKESLLDIPKGLGVGLFQGLSDVGANIAQFPSDIYSYATGREGYKAPKPSFKEYVPESSSGRVASTVGEFAAPLILPGVGGEAAGGKLLTKMLAGAGLGAAESENRALGGALGALGGAIPSTAKLLKGSTSKNIVNKLVEDRKAIKDVYTKNYGDLFKEAAAKGIEDVSKPKINLKTITDSGMPKYYKALEQFMEKPSLENAHWAQSGLGQLERKLESLSERQGLTPPQNKAYREVQSAKDKIREAMFAKHKLGSQPGLAKKYGDITAGYKKDVVPWQSAKGLNEHLRGELKASDLTKKLGSNKKFMAQIGEEYPELKINKLARNPWVQGIAASLLGIGPAHKAYKNLQ